MSLRFPLPSTLPPEGFDVEIKLQSIPDKSLVLKALLNESHDSTGQAKSIYLYGRGEGSEATAEPHVITHISADMVRRAAAAGGNELVLSLTDLAGKPLDAAEVTVAGITVL